MPITDFERVYPKVNDLPSEIDMFNDAKKVKEEQGKRHITEPQPDAKEEPEITEEEIKAGLEAIVKEISKIKGR